MNKAPKKNHYLPRTYLKHFLLDNELFFYLKGKKFFESNLSLEQKIVSVKGRDGLNIIGFENHLYRIKADGVNVQDVEDFFQECGENFLNETIDQINSKEIGDRIDKKIKDKLCLFMASMRVRTPLFKWETDEIESSFFKHETKREIENMTNKDLKKMMNEGKETYTDKEVKTVRKIFIEKKYDLKFPNERFLKMAFSTIEKFYDIFNSMTMNIIRSRSDRYFITSDNPVVYFVPKNKVDVYNNPRSLISRYTEVLFPLTRNLGILLSRTETPEILKAGNRECSDLFNDNISLDSYNFLFSPLQMNSLKKFVEQYIPYPYKVTIK
ncbi:MAG: DUF4238 domain-containing protein [Candidatus Pacebacteria bacterium]|nr:DUF4238 domain-containing protein [Candidatus Paceibacterota bacterium]